MTSKSAATLTIHRAADMTPTGRKRIADWLLQQRQTLLKNAKQLSSRYTARYLYR
jgi:hypothetical protein